MKQIIIYILLILIIPTILILSFKKELNKNKLTKITNEKVRVNRVSKNKIEEIELEDYVMGVVAAEMPLSFEEEALKAQAVCARSYVLRKIIQNKDKEYDVVDTIQNQVYQDDLELRNKWKDKYDDYLKKLKKVVKETTGEYLTYKGEIIETFFFSTSNGKTENSEEVFTKKLPYLRSVDSSWDEETSPVFHTTKQMSLNDFYTKLNLPYNKNLKYEILEKTEAGSIKTIKFNGVTFKGTEVRTKLGLRSTYFDIEIKGSNITFKTTGNGHGVGMSQYGALSMSKKGYNYEEILKYYFKDVEISKI